MKFTFLIVLLITNSIESLKSDHFCKKMNNNSCLNSECGKQICSIDIISCENLNSWQKLIKSFSKSRIEMKNYKNFIDNIKPCRAKEFKNKWSHKFSFE